MSIGTDTPAPRRSGWVSLAITPVIFVLLTGVLLYIALKPLVSPIAGTVGLFFVGAQDQRDLFAAAPAQTERGSIPESEVALPNPGDRYGQISISDTAVNAPLYWNDSPRELNAGVGSFTGSWLPGYGRTVMMTGHSHLAFRDLENAKIGAVVTVETHYGTYAYTVTDTAVKGANDPSAYDLTREDENLVLYTCYPFDFIGVAKERYFVYAEPLSGAPVDRGVSR